MYKIKVNIPYSLYVDIIEDMFILNCRKPSGEINQNEFLNKIIIGVNNFNEIQNSGIKRKILKNYDLKDQPKKKIYDNIDEIIDYIDNFYKQYNEKNSNNSYFMIYPTKKYESFYSYLIENKIRNYSSVSSYIRALLIKYSTFTLPNREAFYKNDVVFDLLTAIDKKILISTIINNKQYYVKPISLKTDIFSRFNYLVSIIKDSNELLVEPLHNIDKVILIEQKFTLSKEETNLINDINYDDIHLYNKKTIKIRIKLTKNIKQTYNHIFNNLRCKYINKNVLEINDIKEEIYHTLINCGDSFEIIGNNIIKKMLHEYYYKCYSKFNDE